MTLNAQHFRGVRGVLPACDPTPLAARFGPGLTPQSLLEKFAAAQVIDIHLLTTDCRRVILPRYTQPEKEVQVLLDQMKHNLPEQPPHRVTASGKLVE